MIHDKTEFVITRIEQKHSKLDGITVNIRSSDISHSESMCNPHFFMNSNLINIFHITIYYVKEENTHPISHGTDPARLLVQALIMSKIDY